MNSAKYAYLLGLYLGDGCISQQSKASVKLRIVQDSKYPDLIAECVDTMSSVGDGSRVGIIDRQGYVEIFSSWAHWRCLFPQAQPGPKNRRRIILDQWQTEIAETYADQLIRGLIHSDGCRYLNTVHASVADSSKSYSYPSYSFTNTSKDILGILARALTTIGIQFRMYDRAIAITRRDAVARLDEFVGDKS